jgi:hypothetical protein
VDRTALTEKVQTKLRKTADKVDADTIDQGIDNAVAELGWSLPLSDAETPTAAFRRLWMLKRSVRHTLETLLIESAHLFKHRQENLDDRFKNYYQLLKEMDEQFEKAMDDEPEKFANVDPTKMFGDTVGPGFVYDQLGRDITYLFEDE